MKNFVQLTCAAILGGTVVLGTSQYLSQQQKQTPIENAASTPSKLTNFVPNLLGTNTTPSVDFTVAAAKTMPTVVHIKSTDNRTASRSPYPMQQPFDPFGFFGDDFFFPSPRGGGQAEPQVASGSGVIISPDGYIVTNNHVVEDADEVEVVLYDKRSYQAKVIGTDPSTDLALIKIEEANLPALRLADSDRAKVGEWVLAVGNPFNLTSTVTAGIVSATGRDINILKDRSAVESFIQTDAAVNPGNSGGALVNIEGDLLGINTAIATPTGTYAGYSFAVPANIVQKVTEDLKTYGIVQRGYLGVTIREVTSALAKEKGLDVSQGVYIDSLTADGAAVQSGIHEGDVIVAIDGNSVHSASELQERIARHHPGDNVQVTVNRKGAEKILNVVLRNKQGTTASLDKSEIGKTKMIEKLGAEFETLSANEAKKNKLKGGVQVTEIGTGILARTQMKEGFIITHVNGEVVNSVETLVKVLENKRGGIMIEGVYPGYSGSHYYAFGL